MYSEWRVHNKASIRDSVHKLRKTHTQIVNNRQTVPWLTKEVLQLMRRRNIAFRKMKKYGRVVYQQDYRKLRNAVVSKVRKNKESFFNRIVPSNQKRILEGH